MAGSRRPLTYYDELKDERILGLTKKCEGLMEKLGHPLGEVSYRIGKFSNAFGIAYKKWNCIVLNRKLQDEEDAAVLKTLYHEMAHLAAPLYAHHGPAWIKICNKITAATGIEITRTSPWELHPEAKKQRDSRIKYEFECPECHCMCRYQKVTRFVREYDSINPVTGEPLWWCTRCRRETGKKVKFTRIK